MRIMAVCVAGFSAFAAAGCDLPDGKTDQGLSGKQAPGQVVRVGPDAVKVVPALFARDVVQGTVPGAAGPDAATRPPVARPAEPPSPSDASPDADTRVQLARLTKDALARREEELAAIFRRLEQALGKIGSADQGSAHEITLEEFAKLVRLQRQMAQEIIDGYAAFRTTMAGYRQGLEQAPGVYRQAAAFYRERAAQETDPLFRKNYTLLAEDCEAYIRLLGGRRDELVSFLRDVAETVTYIEKTARYLQDFEDFVRLSPGLDTSAARRAYREQIKSYVQSFARFQVLFERFSQKLKAQSLSAKLRSEHERAVAAAREADRVRRLREEQERREAETLAARQRRDEEASVQRALVERDEYIALAWQVHRERQAVQQQADALLARRRSRESQTLLRQWQPRWQALDAYLRPPLVVRSASRAVVYCQASLPTGRHFAFARPDGRFVGLLRRTGTLVDGGYEVEVTHGEWFAPGDFMLCKT